MQPPLANASHLHTARRPYQWASLVAGVCFSCVPLVPMVVLPLSPCRGEQGAPHTRRGCGVNAKLKCVQCSASPPQTLTQKTTQPSRTQTIVDDSTLPASPPAIYCPNDHRCLLVQPQSSQQLRQRRQHGPTAHPPCTLRSQPSHFALQPQRQCVRIPSHHARQRTQPFESTTHCYSTRVCSTIGRHWRVTFPCHGSHLSCR